MKQLLAVLAAAFLSGCLSTSNIVPGTKAAVAPNEGIVVIGLSSGASGLFYLGDYREGRFLPDGVFPKGVSLATGEPYIVQPAEATSETRRYGLVTMMQGKKAFASGCAGELPILSVEAGRAQYFGDFTLLEDGLRLVVRHTFDMARAQKYLDETYPGAKLTLSNGIVERGKASECTRPGPTPIYISLPR